MKKKSLLIKSLPFVFTALLLVAFSFSGLAQKPRERKTKASPTEFAVKPKPDAYSYKLTTIAPNEWGFDIYQHGIIVLNYKLIPGLETIKSYSSENLAIMMANFTIAKIRREGFPFLVPVTREALDKAGLTMVKLNPKG